MLDQQLKDQLQAYMGKIRHPITLTASLDETQGSQEMRELLHEIASLSDQVMVDESGTDTR
ncbi:MAG: alkyl hydroperoxide reductase subunit F, partial [Betaproteobacteria bacterium]